MTSDPGFIYSQLLEQRRSTIAKLEERHRALGYAKLAIAGIAIILVGVALARDGAAIRWVLFPAAAFAVLVIVHDRVLRAMERLRRAERYFLKGLARLAGNWQGTGESGERYLEPEHPYAQDLDLFGKASLFELLCTARTLLGQDRLANWLKSPADRYIVRSRQEAVDELRPRIDLREELAVLAEEARTGVHPRSLGAWGESPARLRGPFRGWILVHTTLGIAGFIALWIHLAASSGTVHLSESLDTLLRDIFLAALLINAWFLFRTRAQMGEVISGVEAAAAELGLLSEVLVRIEREPFRTRMLAGLRA